MAKYFLKFYQVQFKFAFKDEILGMIFNRFFGASFSSLNDFEFILFSLN